MGIGYGVGEQRALQAAQSATNSPLLEQTIHGARGLLVNITSSEDLTLAEVDEAMEYIHNLCDSDDAAIYFGHVMEEGLEGSVRITVLATGFNPYTSEGKKVATAAFSVPNLELETPAVVERSPIIKPENSRPLVFPTVANGAAERTSRNSTTTDTSAVFDESDLDIPAFIREHRSKQNP
jgi:cell division protein FtsZ